MFIGVKHHSNQKMDKKLDEILKRINEVEGTLQTDLQKTNMEISEIKAICLNNQRKHNELDLTVRKQQSAINYLQKEVNKNNLIVFGMVENDSTKLSTTLISVIKQNLDIDVQQSEIVKIHKLGDASNGSAAPIKVAFSDFRLKEKIFSARFGLKGTNIYLNEDLPYEYRMRNREKRLEKIRNSRKHLRPQSSEETECSDRVLQAPKRIRDDLPHHVHNRNISPTKN